MLFDIDNEKCRQCIRERQGSILFCEPIGICKYDKRGLRQAGLNNGENNETDDHI